MARVASWFRNMFGTPLPLIGVVHLPALPGAPGNRLSVSRLIARARDDAVRYLEAGFDGLILENYGDVPFGSGPSEPHTVALMTRIGAVLKELAGERPVGINLLRNDALGALAVAVGAGLDFIRVNVLSGVAVTDQGFIEGPAAELLRTRSRLSCSARILADHRVKHAMPLREAGVSVEVEELLGRALADALLVTGPATGRAPAKAAVHAVKQAAGKAPVLVASGVDAGNLAALSAEADGFIVGTSVKRQGKTPSAVDPGRARALARLAASLRP